MHTLCFGSLYQVLKRYATRIILTLCVTLWLNKLHVKTKKALINLSSQFPTSYMSFLIHHCNHVKFLGNSMKDLFSTMSIIL